LRKDDRHHIRRIHFQRNVLPRTAELPVTDHLLGILNRYSPRSLYQ
jgi:hypothetical protein